MTRHIATHTTCLLGKADPTHHGRKHLVPLQIKPHVFNRTISTDTADLPEKEFSDKNLKDNPFCINISCISHQLVPKPLLLISSFFIRHLNIYNLIMIQFLRLILSLTVIFKFLRRIIARSDLASFMHVENPHNAKLCKSGTQLHS